MYGILGKKSFFQNFNTFFCFENDLRATVCKNEPKFLHFDTDILILVSCLVTLQIFFEF